MFYKKILKNFETLKFFKASQNSIIIRQRNLELMLKDDEML